MKGGEEIHKPAVFAPQAAVTKETHWMASNHRIYPSQLWRLKVHSTGACTAPSEPGGGVPRFFQFRVGARNPRLVAESLVSALVLTGPPCVCVSLPIRTWSYWTGTHSAPDDLSFANPITGTGG